MEILPQIAENSSANVAMLPPVRYTFTPTFVTPDMAERLLGTMKQQRRFRRGTLASLERAARGGRWRMMPHGVVIGTNGAVLDGQHRLQVIVETGVGQWLVVIEGCPPEFYGLIDNAMAPKNLEDALRKDGCPPGVISAVGVAVRLLWRRDVLPVEESEFKTRMWPSNDEALAVYRRDRRRLEEAAEMAWRTQGLCPSPGTFAYVLYHGLVRDADKTRAFAEGVGKGLGLEEGDPAALLRNAWTYDRAKGVVRYDYDVATQAAVTLSDHLRGRKRKTWRNVEFGTGRMPPVGR